MSALVAARLPSLSEIANWDVGHLEQASSDWTRSASLWETHFGELHRQVMAHGGAGWDGNAADAAQRRTYTDLVKVRHAADDLRNAAGVARRGAEDLLHARSNVLRAVAAAQRAALSVGEDLSVTVALAGGSAAEQSRQLADAQQRADEIAARVKELSAVDERIASAIASATAPLDDVRFTESPIQLVDNRTFKEGPPIPVPGTPDDPGVKTSGPTAAEIRRVIMDLPQGSKPWIREIRSVQDLENLWKWMRQDGVELPNPFKFPTQGSALLLPDKTWIGKRFEAKSTGDPALNVKIPGERGALKST